MGAYLYSGGEGRVIRSGDYSDGAVSHSASTRGQRGPTYISDSGGFRIAMYLV